MKKIALLVGMIAVSFCSLAQLTVENTLTVEQYVQDVLLGQNVSVSNITYNGQPANQVLMQIGYFQCADCAIGMNSGFIMSTGDAANSAGPNDGLESGNFGVSGVNDPDLEAIVTQAGSNPNLFDYAVIEFDFVPLGDTIRFNYIWASEEYSDFVSDGPTNFNDFFGFFLSGPGLAGPYTNGAVNLAVIPGTDIPVSIGSLNNGPNNNGPCEYCEYFIHNGEGFDEDFPSYSDPLSVIFDGYTTTLTALSEVQCGETYHIKLAISDVGDGGYSSAVFLEEDSFTSNLIVQVDIEFEAGGPEGNTLFETCGEAELTFSRPISNDVNTTFIAELTYSGSAVQGVDYSALPSQVVFPPGVFTQSFPITAFIDNITEGQEIIHLDITNIAECTNEPLQSSFEFYINDQPEPLQVQGYTTSICEGGSIEITPIIDGGYAVYSYNWANGATTPSITVSPLASTTYSVSVADTCGVPSQNADILVEVGVFPPLQVTVAPDPFLVDCFGTNAIATATGGNGDYDDWIWTDANGNNMFGFENNLYVAQWNYSPSITVGVTDGCGNTASTTFAVELTVQPMVVDQPNTVQAVCGEPLTIAPNVTLGQEPYFFTWYDQNFNFLSGDPAYTFTPTSDVSLILNVSDNCGSFNTVNIFVNVTQTPINVSLQPEYNGSCGTVFNILADVSGGSGPLTYIWQQDGTTTEGNTNPLTYQTDATHTLLLSVADGCGAFSQASTTVTITNPQPTLALSEDQIGSCIDEVSYTAEVANGTPDYDIIWTALGNQIGSGPQLNYTFAENTQILCTITDFCGMTTEGTVQFFISNPPLDIEISSDTIICRGTTATLEALGIGGAGALSYQWDYLDSTTTSITVQPGGYAEYNVIIEDQCGQVVEGNVEVEVQDVDPNFTFEYITNEEVQFLANAADSCLDCVFDWNFGDGLFDSSPNPLHTFDGLDQYNVALMVVNPIGCTRISYATVYPPVELYIPNAFTPDGDGVNDVWKFETTGIVTFELFIFNRWGDLVWYSTDPDQAWTGGKLDDEYYVEDDVYPYLIKYTGVDNQAKKLSGTITLLR
jgi:gliding motility-associated-like protein